MRLTDALLGEHAAFYAIFDHLESMVSGAAPPARVRGATAVLGALVASHAGLEEELLFPALEPHLGEEGPLFVMRHEHGEIERAFQDLEDGGEGAVTAEWVRDTVGLLRNHFRKEEMVLFPMAHQLLDDDTLSRLGQAWAEARKVALG